MTEHEFTRLKQRLLANRVGGQIGEAEYRRRLGQLLQQRAAGMPTGDMADGSSGDASTVLTPRNGLTGAGGLKPDQEFGDYRLVAHLGSGAFGHVWKAYSEFEERFVALKILPPDLSRDREEMKRVRRCFRNVHHLHHEYICPVYALAEHKRFGFYLVMGLVEGVPLSAWRAGFGREGPPHDCACRLLSMAARALDYAHSRKVVHRDIKPGNLLTNPDGADLQIVDFGLAEQIHSSMSRISGLAADMAGTPAFMSPEACSGARQDGRSDQYSLGCVAYYLLAGRAPFEGQAMIVVNCHRERMPEPIDRLSKPANAVLQRALAKRASDRYPDCQTFTAELQAALEAKTTEATPPQPADKPTRTTALADKRWRCIDDSVPDEPIVAVAFARNNERLLAGYRDATLNTWAHDDLRHRALAHLFMAPLRDATFTSEGGFVVAAGAHEVAVVDAQSGRRITTGHLPNSEITAVRSCPTGREVCCATDGSQLVFLDLVTGKVVRSVPQHTSQMTGFCLSHNGKWLVECGPDGPRVHTLTRAVLGRTPKFRPTQGRFGVAAEFSGDDRYLAMRLDDGTLQIIEVGTKNSIWVELPEQRIRAFTFSPLGRRVIAVASDPYLRSFDVYSGREDQRFELPAPAERVAVSQSGRVAVAIAGVGIIIADDVLKGN